MAKHKSPKDSFEQMAEADTLKISTAGSKGSDIRFDPADWEWLKRNARKYGLTTSALMRMIIKEWLQEKVKGRVQ